MKEEIRVSDFLGKWTLIVGDINTGKTTLTAKILGAMCSDGLAARIAIIDLAPEIPEDLASRKKVEGAGGRLPQPPMFEVIYLRTRLAPPRLSSRNDTEAMVKSKQNAGRIEVLFKDFKNFNRDILFINEVSIYLQAGRTDQLLGQMVKVSTLIANGYYGQKLGGGIVSARERQEMETLMKYVRSKGQVIRKWFC